MSGRGAAKGVFAPGRAGNGFSTRGAWQRAGTGEDEEGEGRRKKGRTPQRCGVRVLFEYFGSYESALSGRGCGSRDLPRSALGGAPERGRVHPVTYDHTGTRSSRDLL